MATALDGGLHLLTAGLPDMASYYREHHVCATSTMGDIALIRSHVAYWSGYAVAADAEIKPSRGHSYKVTDRYNGFPPVIVKIADHFDHREGVTGWND